MRLMPIPFYILQFKNIHHSPIFIVIHTYLNVCYLCANELDDVRLPPFFQVNENRILCANLLLSNVEGTNHNGINSFAYYS